MVRAILDGSKTMTRRAVKGEALKWLTESGFSPSFVADPGNSLCPYGSIGDQLWVRETWKCEFPIDPRHRTGIQYAADGRMIVPDVAQDVVLRHAHKFSKWKPSIHMPRWASRITLEITDIKVARVQDISQDDATAEGVEQFWETGKEQGGMFHVGGKWCDYPDDAFRLLWDSINAKRGYSWESNCWVWVVSFKRIP